MDYRSKYFKYKNKYLELKELLGGTFADLPANRYSINAVVQLILIGMLYCIKTDSYDINNIDQIIEGTANILISHQKSTLATFQL